MPSPASAITRYSGFAVALLAALFIVRALEIAAICTGHSLPPDIVAVAGSAIFRDFVFFLQTAAGLFVPFIILAAVVRSEHGQRITFGVISTFLLCCHAALIAYFTIAMVPLGADLFGYSLPDIISTIRASATVSLPIVLLFTMPPAVLWLSLVFLSRRWQLKKTPTLLMLGAGVLLTVRVSALPDSSSFQTDLSYNLAVNKAAFLAEHTWRHFRPSPVTAVSLVGVAAVADPGASDFKYLDPQYPFLRSEETPDVLSEHFRLVQRPPTIIIIQIEGLGRAFSGPRAYLGSFTPFLDELAEKSLYWDNFLATQGRTFAALPSILGSLPFANRSFNDLADKMPAHFTLYNILRHNGYRTGFICGTKLSFDRQDEFLSRQSLNNIIGINDYDASYARIARSSWGYADREVLRKTLQVIPTSADSPYLAYVQTVSMHTPYAVPGQDEYLRRFEKRMADMGIADDRKDRYRSYREIYSTIMYTDDALRWFFTEYAGRPDYANTIFIVTGDHRLPEIPMTTKIDRYHVPLLIYSPLLVRPQHILSISSHFDLAPSLLAMLRTKYGFHTPATVTWVGSGLDMEPGFRNIHQYPLKQTTSLLHDYIAGLFFLNESRVFSVQPDLELAPLDSGSRREELMAGMNRYLVMNQQFTRELRLIPDDLAGQFR